jgi:septum formation protein
MERSLFLASSSPRRRELLAQGGISYILISSSYDELSDPSADPETLVKENALGKALAAEVPEPGLVLSADTVVAVDGKVLGKPASSEDAAAMLRLLSDRWHEVYTGVALVNTETRQQDVQSACTRVHFVRLTDREIHSYIATGEPFDKAGAYGIQGRAGIYIDRVEGCYSNVVGLPLSLVRQMLTSFGMEV